MAPDRSTDFGKKLREARERRGVSVRQIANATKISAAALEALERNDISRLPGGIFSRAFVRSYALEVGLDPEETLQAFIEQFPTDSVTVGHPTSGGGDDHLAIESTRHIATTFVRLTLISVPLAIAIVYLSGAGRERVRLAAEPVAAPAPPPPPAPTSGPGTADTARVDLLPSTPVALDPQAPAEKFTVTLTAKRDDFVETTIDGRSTSPGTWLSAGGRTNLDVRRDIELTVRDGGAILVSVNGAPPRPLGKDGEPATVRIDQSNKTSFLTVP